MFSEENYTIINGVKVHIIERGSGQPIVLIHGLAACHYTWRNNIDVLSKKFRVIALDLPGFGFSERSKEFDYSFHGFVCFLNDLFKVLRIEKAYLIGHSFGGIICQYFAKKYFEKVFSIVLISPGFFKGWSICKNRKILKNLMLFSYNDKSLITDKMIKMYRSINSIKGTELVIEKILENAENFFGLNFDDGDRQIENECMIVWGKNDKIVPCERVHKTSMAFKNIRYHIFEDCGHAPHEEKADEFNSLVKKFIGFQSV